ncbi:hypothetical protein ACFS7Z_03540 [Pontibacter toksunensis]|uniref:Lipocalin-like domain-containing protein n=1 Tax=Pontibacter toksunensis TaxID=1332631 RepID=A0ABW6BNJ1_9BACT
MKRKHLHLLWIIALALPFLTACKDDKEIPAPSNTELLEAHEWKGDQLLVMGINVSETGVNPGSIPDIKTTRLTFKKDNTYIAKNGSGPMMEGKWRFNADETKININFLGLSEFDVKELDEENLNLGTSIPKSQLVLLASILNIELGIINMFPDGTEFEIELRFIKP